MFNGSEELWRVYKDWIVYIDETEHSDVEHYYLTFVAFAYLVQKYTEFTFIQDFYLVDYSQQYRKRLICFVNDL